jgi:hypothetical protein
LVLSNVTSLHIGRYEVVLANDYGTVTSSPAILSIFAAPAIACGTDRVVAPGSEWDFDVPTMTGSNPALTVENTVTNQICGQNYNATRTWKVTDDTGLEAFCSQTITVRDPQVPEILTQPEGQSVLFGATVQLEVGISNCFVLTYQWYLNETNVLAGATNATLILSNVTSLQGGSYEVVVTNDYGSVTSSPAVLDVHVPAFIVTQPTNIVIISGQSAEFNVIAGGDQPLTYQWYLNSTNPISGANDQNFTIPNTTIENAGRYSVIVSNQFGLAISQPASLRVLLPANLLSLTYSRSNVFLTFSTVSNLLYSVDYKDDIFSSEWLPLRRKAVLLLGTGIPITVQDSDATNYERFYRIKVE